MSSSLADRVKSTWPVSIGTSLAIESIAVGPNKSYDNARVPPQQIDLRKYEQVWVSLYTLYRNIVSSSPERGAENHTPMEVADVLSAEISIIDQIFSDLSKKRVKCVFYLCNYDGLKKRFPHAKMREENSAKQKSSAEHFARTMELLIRGAENLDQEIRIFEGELFSEKKRTIILTSVCYDLLSEPNFGSGNLHLLETYTGKLKTKPTWYTKFSSSQATAQIPFNTLFLQVFGDSMLFQPAPISVRLTCVNLAAQHNWSYLTTMDRVRLCIGLLRSQDQKAKDFLELLLGKL